MKLLLVSFWFPPTNEIGAVRVGKLAKYLVGQGHDVRVLAGPAIGNLTLPLEIPADLVTRAGEAPGGAGAAAPSRRSDLLQRLLPMDPSGQEDIFRLHYYALRHIPDKRSPWRAPAVAAGLKLFESWRPDLILASGPPFTGLVVGADLSAASGIPWIAELRDPWVGNPYILWPAWRRLLDRALEWRTLRGARALVTVSPLVGRDLARRYPMPVITVLNGYSQDDLPPPAPRPRSERLSIVYTGAVYAGLRDPSALFAAMALLGPRAAEVEVVFYGPLANSVMALAARHGVERHVAVRPGIPYLDSLRRQAAADVLLLLQRNHVSDEGNIPAKFFEYIGVRRPILLLGCETGVIANMIRERGAGVVSNDPATIAAHLRGWLDMLPQGIADAPPAAREGLSREEQFAAYERFLTGGLASPAP